MNINVNEAERRPLGARIEIWENEGGSLGRALRGSQYGRRVEVDRSWTIYHVFTGVPALIDGQAMTGLSRSDATKGMLCLNRRDRGSRSAVPASTANASPEYRL